MKPWIAAAGLTLAAGQAQAHAFTSGADQYRQFVEGAGVPLQSAPLLLCLLPLGLLIGQNGRAAMPRAWPGFVAGLATGWLIAPWVAPDIAVAAVGTGAVLGALAALTPRMAPLALALLALLAGTLTMATALEGHGRWELAWLIPVGVVFGAHLAMVLPAAIVAGSLEARNWSWLRVGWRVIASWLGAIALMYGAFLFRG